MLTLHNIIHGMEFWAALAIFNMGAAWGLLMMGLIWHWSGKDDE